MGQTESNIDLMGTTNVSRLAACLLCFFCFSCKPPDAGAGARLEQTIIAKENGFYDIYYAGNAGNAEKALQDYIQYLASYNSDPAVRRVCYSGKALALARLEFVRSYRNATPFDFGAAVDAFRFYDESVPKLNGDQIKRALIAIITKDDSGRVPWVTPEAIAKNSGNQ